MRGPDWKWGEQDGGEGCVGTLVKEDGDKTVIIQWDAGNRLSCRCGFEGNYDLRVYDTAQVGKSFAFTIQ